MQSIPARTLDSNSLGERLRTNQFGRTLRLLEACTSTNDVAAQLASSGAEQGYTVIAEQQTAGRGRQGRIWSSPAGGIWMTVILRPPFVFSPLDALPLIGALATARTLNSNLNLTSKVRWPNDVVIEHRKLAGILTETQFSGNRFEYALLGIGINANFPSFRLGELAPTCTTLLEVLGSAVDREELISSLLLELERLYQQASNKRESELMDLLWDLDCSRRAHVRIKIGNQELSGVFEGYETFTKVRFRTSQGSHLSLDTSSVENVMYVDL